MTTINENTTIEAVEATEVTKVDELEESLKDYKIRLDSMYNKNEELQNKLKIVKEDNLSVVIPREYIKGLVEAVVESRKVEMIERMSEAEELLERLEADDVKTSIDTIKDYKDRLVEVEDGLGNKVDSDDLEYEIEGYTGYYIEEDEIERMITNAIDDIDQDNDYVQMNDFRHDYKLLEDKISILENKQKQYNKGLLSKLYALIKRLFGYNFKSKVGV